MSSSLNDDMSLPLTPHIQLIHVIIDYNAYQEKTL